MRPRKKDRHLPACVHFRHGAYYLVKQGKWVHLGRDLSEALAEYAKRLKPAGEGFPALVDEAMPHITHGKAQNTVKGYQDSGKALKRMFAEFSPEQITGADVYDMLDALRDRAPFANRCHTVLSLVFKYAIQKRRVAHNPVIGIPRLKTEGRERLLTHAEFQAIRAHAAPRLQTIMDLQLLTGQRIGDVLAIRHSDLTDTGIAFKQAKTGNKLIVRWTPALREAVERAKTGKVMGLWLFVGRRGKRADYSTVSDQWSAACKAAGVLDARLNDIRAMSLTEAESQGINPTALAGHHSPAMTKRYLRSKVPRVVDGPVLDASKKTNSK